MADIQEIYSILLGRGYQEELFSDLTGSRRKEKGGQETLVDCPLCGKENHFSYNRDKPVWRCWSCNEGGDWIKYLEKAKGYTFMDSLQELASRAGVETSPHNQVNYQAYTRRADILETAQDYLADQLHVELKGKPADIMAYLQKRGYSYDDILGMDLGAYTDRKALQDHLKERGYTDQEIQDSGLLTPNFGEEYQLTLLWRDQAGRGTGLVARSIQDPEELKKRGLPEKYKYSAGLKKDQGLIGFSSVRGSSEVILVEGVLDALYLNYKGFKSVAVGGISLSAEQLRALEVVGTKELLLAMDMDQAGQKATEKILKDLKTSKLRAYIVSLPEGYKDPDQLVRQAGSTAFQEALNNAEGGSSWLARRIIARHDISTDRGMDKALDESLEAYSDLEDSLEKKAFKDSLKKATDLTEEELDSRLQEATRTASAKRTQATLQARLKDIQEKASQGDITGAEADLEKTLKAVRLSRGIKLPEPYLLDDLKRDIFSTPLALSTGYKWLDNLAKIPVGALTIIAGRPGQGKTTLQLNLLVNMLRHYPERKFYFFSYEEAKKAIATKLIMILAGEVIHKDTNYGAYVNYLKDGKSNSKIDQAIQEYQRLTSSGRLLISDDMYGLQDLNTVLETFNKQGDIGAVFIDYLQKIPVPSQSQRYLDIKQISEMLLRQAVSLDTPIILGAQLNRSTIGTEPKLADLREGGDIEQDASLVISLYTEAIEKLQEDPEAGVKPDAKVDMKVSVLKNRGGRAGTFKIMTFDRPILTIKQKEF